MVTTTYSFITIFGVIEITAPDWYTRVEPVYKGMEEILKYTIGRFIGDHATMSASLDHMSCQDAHYALSMSYEEFSVHPEKPVTNFIGMQDVFFSEKERDEYEKSLIRTKKEVSYAFTGSVKIKGESCNVIASYEDCSWSEVMLPKLSSITGREIDLNDVTLDENGEAKPFLCITKGGYGSSPMGVYKMTKEAPITGVVPYYWKEAQCAYENYGEPEKDPHEDEEVVLEEGLNELKRILGTAERDSADGLKKGFEIYDMYCDRAALDNHEGLKELYYQDNTLLVNDLRKRLNQIVNGKITGDEAKKYVAIAEQRASVDNDIEEIDDELVKRAKEASESIVVPASESIVVPAPEGIVVPAPEGNDKYGFETLLKKLIAGEFDSKGAEALYKIWKTCGESAEKAPGLDADDPYWENLFEDAMRHILKLTAKMINATKE